jgi:DNA recombination protein RmuC
MEYLLLVAVGIAAALIGGVVGHARRTKTIDAAEEAQKRAELELATSRAEKEAALQRVEQITADRDSLKASFSEIASDQLKANRDEFLTQANERFGKTEQKHVSELEKRHGAISEKFDAFNKTVRSFEEVHRKLESQRTEDFSALRDQVLSLRKQTETLGETNTALSTALRGSSQSRGKWGEMALRNIVEAAGMTEHCDFKEQTTDASGARPDLIVNLPGDACIPIDAKVPFSDYERMVNETDPELRRSHLQKHGEVVRTTMLALAKRDYPEELGGEIDFTVMFIPIESVAAAAFEARPDLQQEAIERHILITTPVTLIALLKTVGLYWKQTKIARDAREIWEASKELHKRMRVFQTHLGKSGNALRQAVDNYNKAIGSLESNVLPQGRRIEQLSGIDASDQLPDPVRVEAEVRALADAGEEE